MWMTMEIPVNGTLITLSRAENMTLGATQQWMDVDAYIWLEDTEMTEVHYWNIDDEAYCVLVPDWKDSNSSEGEIWGFYVTDPDGMCPYVDQGWTYSWWEEGESEYGSMQTPSGEMYTIIDEETYMAYYYYEDDQDWYYDDDYGYETYVDE